MSGSTALSDTHQERVFSIVSLPIQGCEVIEETFFPDAIKTFPKATLYVLWPENETLIQTIKQENRDAVIYGLAIDHEDPQVIRKALRSGCTDVLSRVQYMGPQSTGQKSSSLLEAAQSLTFEEVVPQKKVEKDAFWEAGESATKTSAPVSSSNEALMHDANAVVNVPQSTPAPNTATPPVGKDPMWSEAERTNFAEAPVSYSLEQRIQEAGVGVQNTMASNNANPGPAAGGVNQVVPNQSQVGSDYVIPMIPTTKETIDFHRPINAPFIQEQPIMQQPILQQPILQQKPVILNPVQFPSQAAQTAVQVPKETTVGLNYTRLDSIHEKSLGAGRQTIVVTSPKGGVGKTTVSTNLAMLLQETNGKKSKVVIVDAMAKHGNVSTRLQMKSDVNIKSWERYMGTPVLHDGIILDQLVARHPNGLYVVPSVRVGESYTTELLRFVISNLSKVFDYVIVDIGPEDMDGQLEAMSHANHVFMIVDYDYSTIIDTQEYCQTWDAKKVNIYKMKFIVNEEPAKKGRHGLSREDVKRFFTGFELLGFLPEVPHMKMIHNEGKILVQADPKSPYSETFTEIVGKIVPGYKREEKKGFFGSLFGKGNK